MLVKREVDGGARSARSPAFTETISSPFIAHGFEGKPQGGRTVPRERSSVYNIVTTKPYAVGAERRTDTLVA